MADPLTSRLLGADPEADVILSELRSSGEGGRAATVPTRQDLGLSSFAGKLSRKLSRAADIMEGKQQDPLQSMQQILNVAKAFQELGADPAGASKWLAESASEAGVDLPPELFSQAFSDPMGIEALAQRFPDILAIPKSSRRKLLADPTFLRNLLDEGKEKVKKQAEIQEARRKEGVEQGLFGPELEEFVSSGKPPSGGTPKQKQTATASQALVDAREAATKASNMLSAIRSGTKPPTFNELTLMIQRLAKTRENLEFSVGIPEDERRQLIENIDKSIAAVGGMLNTISERQPGGKPKPAEKPKAEAAAGPPSGLPAAKDNKGKTFKDTETGKRWRSDGATWLEVK